MDSKWGEFPEYDPMRVKYLGAQINKLFDEVEKHMGVKVNEEKFKKALGRNADYMKAMGQLSMVMNADPVPISMATVSLARFLGTADTRWARVAGREAVETLIQEVQKRVDKGYGVVPKGAPRVLAGFPAFTDPGLIHMIEEAGLAVVAMTLMAPLRVKSWESDQPTLGEQRAEIEMRVGFYHSNYAIAKRWAEVAQDSRVDGFIWNYLFNCRPIASTSHLLKKVVEEETGIPVLSLEVDIYDSRYYSPATLKTRVETFADILRARKAARG
jgi:benzoyl-CoA reductase/2-hydroxyglutaryl-CoA dehydratase subunit BcrC/BadD/HgdB